MSRPKILSVLCTTNYTVLCLHLRMSAMCDHDRLRDVLCWFGLWFALHGRTPVQKTVRHVRLVTFIKSSRGYVTPARK